MLFCFNNLSLKHTDEGRPTFHLRRKNKQYCQTKIKLKATSFEILIEGRKIEEDGLDFGQLKKKLTLQDLSQLII